MLQDCETYIEISWEHFKLNETEPPGYYIDVKTDKIVFLNIDISKKHDYIRLPKEIEDTYISFKRAENGIYG